MLKTCRKAACSCTLAAYSPPLVTANYVEVLWAVCRYIPSANENHLRIHMVHLTQHTKQLKCPRQARSSSFPLRARFPLLSFPTYTQRTTASAFSSANEHNIYEHRAGRAVRRRPLCVQPVLRRTITKSQSESAILTSGWRKPPLSCCCLLPRIGLYTHCPTNSPWLFVISNTLIEACIAASKHPATVGFTPKGNKVKAKYISTSYRTAPQ